MSEIKDWLIPVSVFISLIGVTIKFWQAASEYKIKLEAETRLQSSAQAENDTKLVKLFTEIMSIAHGRRGYVVSEKAIESLFSKNIINDLMDVNKINKIITDSSIITLPVGAAEQAFAIATIGILGKKHDILKPIAIEALKSLNHVNKELSDKYLNDIEKA